MFGLLSAIPLLGDVVRITNAYTYDGDRHSDFGFAPIHLWFKKHLISGIVVTVLTLISAPPEFVQRIFAENGLTISTYATVPAPSPGGLIISIFPNLLGFGIGVYALIFSLSAIFIKQLQHQLETTKDNGARPIGSALMLNADMAYPLLVMALSIGIGILQGIYAQLQWLAILSWMALWYSLLMALEILAVLFSLGENGILEKLKDHSSSER